VNGAKNCTAVSFRPSWYNAIGKVVSRQGKSPGNCFLKHDVRNKNIVASDQGVLVATAVAFV